MSKYQQKDKEKFRNCTHLITRGANGSSSHLYQVNGIEGLDLIINNITTVTHGTNVGVSVNGNRRNRKSFDKALLLPCVLVGAHIVADNFHDSRRAYNIGERELAEFLLEHDYQPSYRPSKTVWTPK